MRTSGIDDQEKNQANQTQGGERGSDHSHSRGKLWVVGIGPGDLEQMSLKAYNVLKEAEVIVGYKTYIKLVEDLIEGKEIVNSGMTKEVDRSLFALERAYAGKKVAVISSGDAGIYGMAGIVLELLLKKGWQDELKVEVVPGITSSQGAAASLGAPLMHDFVTISLSDLLTPWELIEKRLNLAAQGDFIITLYNPMSKKRREQIKIAQEIFLKYKSPKTPVGIVRNAKRAGEEVTITDLESFLEHPIDMFTMIIVGNSETFTKEDFMITPRGYKV